MRRRDTRDVRELHGVRGTGYVALEQRVRAIAIGREYARLERASWGMPGSIRSQQHAAQLGRSTPQGGAADDAKVQLVVKVGVPSVRLP